jgi:uncharacterized protein (DUF885 family)
MTACPLTRRAALGGIAASASTFAITSNARALEALASPAPQALLDDIAWRLLEVNPEQATTLGVDTGQHSVLRSRLKDNSAAGVAAQTAQLKVDLARVEAVNCLGLDPTTQTSLAVVKSAFRTALQGFALPYGDVAVGGWRNAPYVVIQNVGAYLDTPRFLDGDHPVRDEADAEAYLARLGAMAGQLDGELERLRSAGAMSLIAPSFLLDKTISQMQRLIADAQSNSGGAIAQSLVHRTTEIPGDWQGRARSIIQSGVVPALVKQLAELQAQRGRAVADAGMWARPHGDEWYAWGLRASTTTSHSADEIHRMGHEQLAELQGRMDPILRKIGYTTGTVGERMAALDKDPRYMFSNDDEGRAEIVAMMQATLDFIRTRLPLAFRELVPGKLEIRRLPLAEEAGAPAAYGGAGSIDGSIPGKIWINLGNTDLHRRFSVADLTFHEGIPGHVWQGEYANRLPLIRSILAFNAYSEGWALYAQQLGDELGAYDDDPVGRLGYLQGLSFRACRMVVDTGLHSKQWTRQRAVEWFMQANGSGLAEISSEIDRYCSWPGQACGYKMGHSEINSQRQRAKTSLGSAYDLRDFDQAVVGGGNVPLDVLAENVSRYITATPH